MRKVIQFNSKEKVEIKNETLSGLIIKIKAMTSVPAKAVVSDYSKIYVDVVLRRANSKTPLYIFRDYMDKLIPLALGNTKLNTEMYSSSTDDRYLKLNFKGSVALHQGDVIEVSVNAQNTSFTSLSIANSDITIETIPSIGATPTISVYEVHPIQSGQTNIDLDLKDGVTDIMMYSEIYGADTHIESTKSKVIDLELTSANYRKSVTSDVIFAENIEYHDMLSLTAGEIYNLYLYKSNNVLSNCKLKAKLDVQAVATTSVLVSRRVMAF